MTQDSRRCFSYVVVIILVISGALAAQTRLPKYDISGIWLLDVDTPRARGVAEVSFKLDGGKLSGHYSSPAFGENELTGTLSGQDLSFQFRTDVENPNNGRKLTILVGFRGTVEDEKSMRGTISVGPWGRGTFTGARRPEK